jgi:hypothetical protein
LLTALSTGCAAPRTLIIKSTAPFKEGIKVSDTIRRDCELQYDLPHYVEPFSRRHFKEISLQGDIPASAAEEVLSMKIVNLTSQKIKGMQSGPTSLTVEGVLTKNGSVIGSFIAFRDAGEELVTRDRGECHFLKFCAKAIGKDISRWLGNPEMNSNLGKKKRHKGRAGAPASEAEGPAGEK